MWPYWMLFLLPASGALREQLRRLATNTGVRPRRWNAVAIAMVLFVTLMVGYRHDVGGDWAAYRQHYDDLQYMSLSEVLTLSDPGYALVNWISAQVDMGIYGVNLMCGAIFAIGLMHFCLTLPRPWLAVTAAVPYMLIVVAMGYSRQAVALGFTMLGLVALKNRSTWRFAAWVLVGATFHKTAVMILPIAALANSKSRLWSLLFAGIATYAGYIVLLQDSFETMYTNYVGTEIQSQGALIRLLMNAVASVLLLMWVRYFQFSEQERSLWKWMAWISVGALVALFAVSSASTALDRMALYLLPVQLVVFSHLPDVYYAKTRASPKRTALLIIVYFALVQFVWLNFANYAGYWLPYQFYPLVSG